MNPSPTELSRSVKSLAAELGFDLCGIAEAVPITDGGLEAWLAQGHAAGMSYMGERVAERLDPRRVVPGARSVVALALNYFRPEPEPPPSAHIARYARGRDYHLFLRRRVRKLRQRLLKLAPAARIHPSVDTSPVMEKVWAQRAGLGWIGKNGLLLTTRFGSWVLLATLITDLEIAADAPHPERCGSCRACLPSCPTGALLGEGRLDSRRCIAYWTIESRDEIPVELRSACGEWVFGCDRCQEVCPWNREARAAAGAAFDPHPLTQLTCRELAELTPESFATLAVGSPLRRPGRDGLRRNAVLALHRQGGPGVAELCQQLSDDPSPVVRETAGWVAQEVDRQRASTGDG